MHRSFAHGVWVSSVMQLTPSAVLCECTMLTPAELLLNCQLQPSSQRDMGPSAIREAGIVRCMGEQLFVLFM
jgi:hypothetical protein